MQGEMGKLKTLVKKSSMHDKHFICSRLSDKSAYLMIIEQCNV